MLTEACRQHLCENWSVSPCRKLSVYSRPDVSGFEQIRQALSDTVKRVPRSAMSRTGQMTSRKAA